MKVVVIGSLAHSLVNFRGPLLRRLQHLGHQVSAWAGTPDPHSVAWLQQHHIDFQELPVERGRIHLAHDMILLLTLLRKLRKIRPDLILTYTIKPVIYGSWAAHLLRIPKIFSIITGIGSALLPAVSHLQQTITPPKHVTAANLNDSTEKQGTSSLLPHLLARMYRHSLAWNHGVFFQNPDDLDFFQQHQILPSSIPAFCVAGSGVDLSRFSPAVIPTGPPSFLLMARMLYNKGIAEYVQAARILKTRYPHVRFQVLGPLDTNPSAIPSEIIQRWTFDGKIEYLGLQQDVRPFLAQASVYVLPSYREGTPRSVLEAMATGRPIITTDAPGCRETVQHGYNGYLVPVRDVPALAIAMEQFIQHPERIASMGQNSLSLVRERFDVELVNQTMLETMGFL